MSDSVVPELNIPSPPEERPKWPKSALRIGDGVVYHHGDGIERFAIVAKVLPEDDKPTLRANLSVAASSSRDPVRGYHDNIPFDALFIPGGDNEPCFTDFPA